MSDADRFERLHLLDEHYLDEVVEQECCGASLTLGPTHDPYGSECELAPGHYPETDHEGLDPFGGDGKVTWRGGGMCAGDPLPYWHLHLPEVPPLHMSPKFE